MTSEWNELYWINRLRIGFYFTALLQKVLCGKTNLITDFSKLCFGFCPVEFQRCLVAFPSQKGIKKAISFAAVGGKYKIALILPILKAIKLHIKFVKCTKQLLVLTAQLRGWARKWGLCACCHICKKRCDSFVRMFSGRGGKE